MSKTEVSAIQLKEYAQEAGGYLLTVCTQEEKKLAIKMVQKALENFNTESNPQAQRVVFAAGFITIESIMDAYIKSGTGL